jgi:hypothetical protein
VCNGQACGGRVERRRFGRLVFACHQFEHSMLALCSRAGPQSRVFR